MTINELEAKWPRHQFDELKAQGYFHHSTSYEKYLNMRRKQEEIAEEGRRLGLTGDEPPELTEADIAAFDRNWAELGREIELKRRMELEAKWPRSQFEKFKAKGHSHPDDTYEEYLDMRREQEEIAEEGRRLGLTGDEPPELTEEDEAIFDRVWAKQAREQEQVREELAA